MTFAKTLGTLAVCTILTACGAATSGSAVKEGGGNSVGGGIPNPPRAHSLRGTVTMEVCGGARPVDGQGRPCGQGKGSPAAVSFAVAEKTEGGFSEIMRVTSNEDGSYYTEVPFGCFYLVPTWAVDSSVMVGALELVSPRRDEQFCFNTPGVTTIDVKFLGFAPAAHPGTQAPAAPELSGELARKVWNALQADAVTLPVGGGIVMQKKAELECVSASMAAPGGPLSHTYGCGSLNGEDARAVMAFLDGELVPNTATGGMATIERGVVECIEAAAAGVTQYSCKNAR